MNQKAILRKHLLETRNRLNPENLSVKNEKVLAHLRGLKVFREAEVVALYAKIGSEFDFSSIMSNDKTYVYPRIDHHEMVFVKVDEKTKWKKSSFGVMEPIGSAYMNTIDLMIVPLLGVSKDHYRIGYGKGYYDRFLSKNRPNFCLSYVMDFQVVEFTHSNHDQSLDAFIII